MNIEVAHWVIGGFEQRLQLISRLLLVLTVTDHTNRIGHFAILIINRLTINCIHYRAQQGPFGLAGTENVLEFIAQEISRQTYINLMDQYHPCYRAAEYAELSRPVTAEEYREALDIAQRLGLTRLDHRRSVRPGETDQPRFR